MRTKSLRFGARFSVQPWASAHGLAVISGWRAEARHSTLKRAPRRPLAMLFLDKPLDLFSARRVFFRTALIFAAVALCSAADIRLGIIGTDTSHAVEFTKLLNDESAPDRIPGARVVAAFKGGSADIASSISRVDQYA